MKKLVIYLDQNLISDIAKLKAGLNEKVKPELKELFEIIKQGVDEEKFVVPDSMSIKTETAAALDPKLIHAIRTHLKYLGQVSLKSKYEITDLQFEDALLKYLQIPSEPIGAQAQAFNDDPDKRMKNFDIDIGFPHIDMGSSEVAMLQQIRDSGVSFNGQYEEENKINRQYYKARLDSDFKYFLYHHSISKQDAERFIDSSDFLEIPIIEIFTKLWSLDLSKKGRKGKKSDSNDIDAISSYLPYCDVMTVDHYMATNIRHLGLDKKYNCRIYTMKDKDLSEMKEYLKSELETRPPANESAFSVCCYLSEQEQYFNGDFVDMINSSLKDYLRRNGKLDKNTYISVFFIQNSNYNFTKEILVNTEKKNGKTILHFNGIIVAEMKIFGYHFESLIRQPGATLESVLAKIPNHKKGQATIFIPNQFNQIDFAKTKDIDLFDDIAESIKQGADLSVKYKIKIIYNK